MWLETKRLRIKKPETNRQGVWTVSKIFEKKKKRIKMKKRGGKGKEEEEEKEQILWTNSSDTLYLAHVQLCSHALAHPMQSQ